MADLETFAQLVRLDHGLCVVVATRSDGTMPATVVNAGVLTHPTTGLEVVGFVAAGRTRKLEHLRADKRATIVVRAGWQWATVEGRAELVGPDDPHPDLDAERIRALLQDVFRAAGGTHDDWDTFDRTMRDERRAAVLISPTLVYSNPSS
jgi:PPOX class probable F420-dependent enzyme